MGVPELGVVRYCTACLAVYDADFVRCPNDGGALAVGDVDPLIGTSVGHYRVDAYVGAGAMGRVYRCHHAHLHHKHYALKILRGDLAATMAMRLRFTQEAEAASRLVHPNVVSVVDFGRTESGLLYLVMDFVEGDSLAKLIARGPLAPARTIQLAKELCRGLTHAHDLGFVHRDFKPENIIVVREGAIERPRIVDFGLAIHAVPDPATARLTIAGGAVGTPTYAAPEQMQHVDDVDHRADLFALGITMFEMLAGRTPFDGSMLEILHLNIAGERPTIASRAAAGAAVAIPPSLERLVQRLIAPSPDDRPASTRDVLESLDAIEVEVARGTPVSGIERAQTATSAPHPTHRPRRAAVLVVTLAAAAGVGAAAYVAIAGDDAVSERPELRVTTPAPETAAPEVHAAATEPSVPDQRPAALPPPDKRTTASHRRRVVARVVAPDPTPLVEPEPPIAASEVTPPSPPAPPDAPPAPRLDERPPPARIVTSATVAIDALAVRGALTPAQVRRAIDRELGALRACYGPAVTKAGRSPSTALRTHFEIDETQRAHAISTSGDFPDLISCVDAVLANVRTEVAPDVGVVDVAFRLRFVPEGS